MSSLKEKGRIWVGHRPDRSIALYQGDLSALTSDDEVDILVVSAFNNDYTETAGSLIGALGRRGIHVDQLARSKAFDERERYSCWLSEEVVSAGFRRLLCFEPYHRGSPPEVVDDIFDSLNLVATKNLLSDGHDLTVAMPLVSSGDMGWNSQDILQPLVEAAVHWLRIGLPLKELMIVEIDDEKADRLSATLTDCEEELMIVEIDDENAHSVSAILPDSEPNGQPPTERPKRQGSNYDVFVSYAHEDAAHVDKLVDELRSTRPGLRVFVDRNEILTGAKWVEELASALDECSGMVAVFSNHYFESRMCRRELNVAVIRENKTNRDLLYPVYLFSVDDMPTLYQTWQYEDCREGDIKKLKACSHQLAARLA